MGLIVSITKAGTIEVVTGNYKYNDIEVPSPTYIECEYHRLNRAWNDAHGNEKVKYIGSKRAVTHYYKNVSVETFNKIRDMLDLDGENQYINLTTQFDGYDGTIEMYVRVGSPVKTTHVFSDKDRRIVSFELHFIEPYPIKKNEDIEINEEIYDEENIKALFYFDNGLSYEVYLKDTNVEKFITYFIISQYPLCFNLILKNLLLVFLIIFFSFFVKRVFYSSTVLNSLFKQSLYLPRSLFPFLLFAVFGIFSVDLYINRKIQYNEQATVRRENRSYAL